MQDIDFTKTWVFIRQLILVLGGLPFLANFIDPETLVKILDAIGTAIPGLVVAGTLIYGLFFSRPAKAADVVKGQDL